MIFLAERALIVTMESPQGTPMERTVLGEIERLRGMTVGELQTEWQRLYGESTRSRNKTFLFRRLAWRVQELAHGGLSTRATSRIAELAPHSFVRSRTPSAPTDAAMGGEPTSDGQTVPHAVLKTGKTSGSSPVRDPRLPSPGTVLSRQYHGQEIRVMTLEHGFEWDGQRFGSLSAVARAITGSRWNGPLFFGLTKRKRKS